MQVVSVIPPPPKTLEESQDQWIHDQKSEPPLVPQTVTAVSAALHGIAHQGTVLTIVRRGRRGRLIVQVLAEVPCVLAVVGVKLVVGYYRGGLRLEWILFFVFKEEGFNSLGAD